MKQKITLIIAFFLSLTPIIAQKSWNVGITAGTGLSGWYTNADNGWFSPGEKAGMRFAATFYGGIDAVYPFAKRWKLYTGILYQNSVSRWVQKYHTVAHAAVQDRFKSVSRNTFRLQQLQIPIQLQIQLGKKPKSPYLNLGVLSNYILTGTKKFYSYSSRSGEKFRSNQKLDFSIEENRSSRFYLQPALGIGFPINKRLTFTSNLTWGSDFVNYSLSPSKCVGDCELGARLYNKRSWQVGLRYQLF